MAPRSPPARDADPVVCRPTHLPASRDRADQRDAESVGDRVGLEAASGRRPHDRPDIRARPDRCGDDLTARGDRAKLGRRDDQEGVDVGRRRAARHAGRDLGRERRNGESAGQHRAEAVAGAPTPMADHADAAVGMAVDILTEAGKIKWPSGDPIVVRGGIATGPAVAGVIGVQRFAYDLWGDTVNLASRLETNAGPGRFLVSEWTARELADRYDFGPSETLEVKGRGPTTVRVLLGRHANVPIMAPLAPEVE